MIRTKKKNRARVEMGSDGDSDGVALLLDAAIRKTQEGKNWVTL